MKKAGSPSPRPHKIKRIKRAASLSSQVTVQLENFIVGQRLNQGAKLPTERELAERFEVSRTVVREAIRGLVANGMLEVNPGSGTLIKRPSAANLMQTMSHYLRLSEGGLDHTKITEVRRLLEVEIAGLAAQRRTAADIEQLRGILEDYKKVKSDRASFSKWDVSFHAQLASATQNELLRLLIDSISGIMTKVREISFTIPGSSSRALRFHTTIFAQVEAGNVHGARQAMREHIEDSESVMAKSLAALERGSRK